MSTNGAGAFDGATVEALEIARALAAAGVPVFLARQACDDAGQWLPEGGHGGCGYWLPRAWETTAADPAVVDRWRPGMALAAVMGHAVDGIDVDPRHGGEASAAQLADARCWPTVIGRQATPSGGWHDLVNPLAVRSRDGVLPGIDVKAGLPDGTGRGFLFLAPTVKLSKATGELLAYTWTLPPVLDELDPSDDSGQVLAERIRARAHTEPVVENTGSVGHDHPSFEEMGGVERGDVEAYLGRVVRAVAAELTEAVAWPEEYRDDHGRGWQKLLADVCNRFGRLAHANWTPWSHDDARRELDAVVPGPMAQAVDIDKTWAAQSDRRAPASFPSALDDAAWLRSMSPATPRSARGTPDRPDTAGPQTGVDPVVVTEPPPRPRGQVRMAYRLARAYENRLMHVHGLGWHSWDGARWRHDDRGESTRAVLATLRRALAESLYDKQLRSDANRCQTAFGIRGVLDIAAALEPFARTVADLDADPYLLNCANGTLDLRDLTLRPHDPTDLVTKVATAAYDPEATGQVWQDFLARVLPDEEVRSFLQRYVGLALCGRVLEHVLAILTGVGRNGKGVFYGAVATALGDYACSAEPDLFMHREGAHPTGEMDLRGRRWVVVSESEHDRRLAEATVKRLTGGDTIRARRMRQDFVEFTPSHTAALVTNHLPRVSGDDPALWARLRVVPFDVVIPDDEQDPHLPERLALEADAALAWAVAGWQDYRERGLAEPPAVLKATNAYHADSDAVARFLEDCCFVTTVGVEDAAEIWRRWSIWCGETGAEPMSKKLLGDTLEKRGFPAAKAAHGRRVRRGLTLLAGDDAEDETR